MAERFGCTAAITGKVDVVTDGRRLAKTENGVAEMGRITGTGCMLSGVIGAYVGANGDAFMACVAAVASMGLAGEWALAETNGRGTGSLHIGIIDALSRIGDVALAEQGKVRYETFG